MNKNNNYCEKCQNVICYVKISDFTLWSTF